jgi:hypothetical protein
MKYEARVCTASIYIALVLLPRFVSCRQHVAVLLPYFLRKSSCSWFRASSFIKLNKNQLDAALF